ncbi:unnamed protein product [Mucor hiemalis]
MQIFDYIRCHPSIVTTIVIIFQDMFSGNVIDKVLIQQVLGSRNYPAILNSSLNNGKMKQQENQSLNKEVRRKKKKEIMAKAATNYINNKLHIENKYASLISLIDTIYPPLLCTLCDTVSTSRNASNAHFKEYHKKKSRYLCIHPHCDKSFVSRGALRFHISRSHLVHYSKKPLPNPIFVHYNGEHGEVVSSPLNSPTLTTTTTPTASISSPKSQSPSNTTPTTILNTPTKESLLKPSSIHIIPALSSPKKRYTKKERIITPTISSMLIEEDLTPSPPPSPFSLYHSRKNSQKKPTLSTTAEAFLNSMYPPLQCPACHQLFNRKTNVIKHLTEAHLGQEPYRCIYPKCAHPRLYATREGLIYHIVRVHDDDDVNTK